MNLGVYGCSFSTHNMVGAHLPWYNLLASKLGGVVYNFESKKEGITYGLGAAPTFYSYKRFIKNYKKHDLNIFIITDPLKYTKLVTLNGIERPVCGVNNIDNFILESKDQSEIELLKDIRSWYMVSDKEFLYTVQEIMIQDIERLSKNKVLLIPADLSWVSKKRLNTLCMDFGLWDLVYKQIECLRPNKNFTTGLQEKHDKIAAHFTEETNMLFADMIFEYIMNKTKMTLPKRIPHKHSWDYYYI